MVDLPYLMSLSEAHKGVEKDRIFAQARYKTGTLGPKPSTLST